MQRYLKGPSDTALNGAKVKHNHNIAYDETKKKIKNSVKKKNIFGNYRGA